MTDSETETLPREVDKRKQALFTDLGSGFWSDETQKHKPSVKNHRCDVCLQSLKVILCVL